MKKLLSAFLIVLSFVSLGTFAQDNPIFRHLPPDATSIYQINVPALALKLPWQELAQKMASAPKGKSDHMMQMMQNPLATGINITKELFVAETDKANPDSATYTTIILYLADSGKFAAFLNKQEPGLRFFSYPGKGRGAAKDKYGAAWNKEMAVLTIVKPAAQAGENGMAPSPSKGKTTQPAPKKPTPGYALLAAKKSLEALNGYSSSVYISDPVFKAGFADDADMHMWMQQGAGLSMLTKLMKHKTPMGNNDFMKAMSMQRSHSHTLTELRFETGKITVKSSTVVSPDTLAIYQKLFSKSLNTDLVTSLPKGQLLAMINLHLNPTAFTDILDMSHQRAKADSMLATKGLTSEDITRAFKGDILLAVMNPADNAADSTAGDGKPKMPSVYIATTIADMPSFMKLAGKMKLWKDSAGMSSDSSQGSPSLMEKLKMTYTLKNNILVISTSKQNTDGWFSNTEKRSADFIPALVKDNPFSILIDVKTVMNFLQSMSKADNSEKNKKIMHAISQLETLIIAGGSVQDGRVQSTFELKLTDSSENSLKALVKMF